MSPHPATKLSLSVILEAFIVSLESHFQEDIAPFPSHPFSCQQLNFLAYKSFSLLLPVSYPDLTMEKICQKICLVIYADGFHLHDQFYCRELAFVTPNPAVAPQSVHFKVISPRTRLEHQHVDDMFDYVHGLCICIKCIQKDGMDQKDLSTFLATLYERYQSPERPFLAIQGKDQFHQLFNVLKELDIPVMDLERLGCPSFEALSESSSYTCGRHSLGKRCAQLIVAHCRHWMMQTIRKAMD